MLEFVFAAALLLDPSPVSGHPEKTAKAAVGSVREARQETVLSAVAVTLECTAKADGRVENCEVLGETHPGLGFGDAAIALMRDTRVEPGPRDIQFAHTIQFMP